MKEFSSTLANLNFMKKKEKVVVKPSERTFSYYACKNIIHVFRNVNNTKNKEKTSNNSSLKRKF